MHAREFTSVTMMLLAAAIVACSPGDNEEPASAVESNEPADPPPSQVLDTHDTLALIPGEPKTAVAAIGTRSGSAVTGEVTLTQQENLLSIRGTVSGLAPGQHGFHIHETGDCSADDGSSAGGHFAPAGSPHGAPSQPVSERHAGDLGNIVADDSGTASIEILSTRLSLIGERTVVGRAVVVHSGEDDLVSQPSGDAGSRVGCGVIEAVDHVRN